MRSAEQVKDALTDHLESVVPTRCASIAAEIGKPVPAPVAWKRHPMRHPGPSEWPSVWVSELSRPPMTSMDWDDIYPRWQVRYEFGIEFWVNVKAAKDRTGEALESVTDVRSRLERAIIESLLYTPSLSVDWLLVDPLSIAGDYSPVFELATGQQACAEELRVTVIADETVTPTTPDVPLSIETVTVLEHPAAD